MMKQLITEKEIDIQSKIVAKQINDKHRGDKTPVVFVGLLNGCFMFYSDFIKNITLKYLRFVISLLYVYQFQVTIVKYLKKQSQTHRIGLLIII